MRRSAVAVAAMIVALALGACGGGSSSSENDTTAAASPPSSGKAEKRPASGKAKEPNAAKEPGTTKESGAAKEPSATTEPSAEFAGKGENGELAAAGKESTVEEREAASKVVEEALTAATNGEWAKQCALLAQELVEGLESRSKATGKLNCPESLKLTGSALGGTPRNPMVEPLAALRVNGIRAFAFFHGVEKRNFVIPMALENGQWKVAALGPQETP